MYRLFLLKKFRMPNSLYQYNLLLRGIVKICGTLDLHRPKKSWSYFYYSLTEGGVSVRSYLFRKRSGVSLIKCKVPLFILKRTSRFQPSSGRWGINPKHSSPKGLIHKSLGDTVKPPEPPVSVGDSVLQIGRTTRWARVTEESLH